MKLLKNIIIGLLVIAVLFVVISFFLPSKMHVEQSIVVDSPPSAVFEEVNNLKAWDNWSPWKEEDNTLYQNATYEGPEKGKGSKMSWKSENKNVGSGSQKIIDSKKNKMIKTELSFDGWDGKSHGMWAFEKAPEGGTKVTWVMEGELNGIFDKYIGQFMAGKTEEMFSKGLNNLKTYVESKPTYAVEISVEKNGPIHYLGIRETIMPEEIGSKMGEHYGELMQYQKNNKIKMAGAPLAVYYAYSKEAIDLESAIHVAEKMETKHSKIKTGEIPAGKCVKSIHWGHYEGLETTHNEIARYIADNNLTIVGAPWEVYITDPMSEADTSKWLTHVFYPIQ